MFKRLFVSALDLAVLAAASPAQELARNNAPVLIKEVKPEYTKQARDAGIEGTVVLDGVVLKDGTRVGLEVYFGLKR
jgi:outer membrane biosynthesis protein TonB